MHVPFQKLFSLLVEQRSYSHPVPLQIPGSNLKRPLTLPSLPEKSSYENNFPWLSPHYHPKQNPQSPNCAVTVSLGSHSPFAPSWLRSDCAPSQEDKRQEELRNEGSNRDPRVIHPTVCGICSEGCNRRDLENPRIKKLFKAMTAISTVLVSSQLSNKFS